jgi:hypothetical protein
MCPLQPLGCGPSLILVNNQTRRQSKPAHLGLSGSGGSVTRGRKPGRQDRRTALHLAAEKGHLEVVRCLLQCGANVSAVNQV